MPSQRCGVAAQLTGDFFWRAEHGMCVDHRLSAEIMPARSLGAGLSAFYDECSYTVIPAKRSIPTWRWSHRPQVSVQLDEPRKQRARKPDAFPRARQTPGGRHRHDRVTRPRDRVAFQHLGAVEHPVRRYHVPIAESP